MNNKNDIEKKDNKMKVFFKEEKKLLQWELVVIQRKY